MNPDKTIDALVETLCNELGADEFQKLAGALDRLQKRAMCGDEDATRIIVSIGNIATSSLFVLWAGPGHENRVAALRKIASEQLSFPVSFSPRAKENSAWKVMIKDLGVGSGRAEKFLKKGRPAPLDVVSAIVDALSTIEHFKNQTSASSIPSDYRKIVQLELVRENADKLAAFLVQKFEESDPEFRKLSAGGKTAFETFGRNFSKGEKNTKDGFGKRRERAMANESIPPQWSGGSRGLKKWEAAFNDDWRQREKAALDAREQTVKSIRSDLIEAVTGRLKSRLKSYPIKSV